MSTVPVLPDNTIEAPGARAPLVLGGNDFASVTEKVCSIVERPRLPRAWYVAFTISCSLTALLLAMVGYLFLAGIGVWGLNVPVGWGFDITNFVFWVGIGHAGTLISAILFLFRQKWRTGINRFAEAMTIFAVICAGLFPAIHTGRPWFDYWLFPYPNQMSVWPNFRSPLLWDVFAVSTYFTVSLMFWFTGMVPDLATLRDRATTKGRRIVYGILSLGWRGSGRHWHRYERVYLLLAALAAPLVLSVHSVVSFDFAVAQLPGWHSTIFPPYFVAGAIFSGFAMVITLLVTVRAFFGLQDLITTRMPMQVVDPLEPVEVDEEDTDDMPMAVGQGKGFGQAIRKVPAIGHPGDQILEIQFLHPALKGFDLRLRQLEAAEGIKPIDPEQEGTELRP